MSATTPLKIGITHPVRTFQMGDYIPAEHGGVPIGGTAGQVLAKVDATDHNTAWATPSGGGGGSIVEKTHAEMVTLIAATDLTVGQFYNITDAAGSDLGVIVLATTDATVSVDAIGGYSSGWMPVEYDFANNLIIYRSDLALNVVRGGDSVTGFPWGNAAYQNNKVEPGTALGITLGSDCQVLRNQVGSSSLFLDNTFGDFSTINDNFFGNSVTFYNNVITYLSMNNNNVDSAAVVQGCTGTNATLNSNDLALSAAINTIAFGDGSSITSNTLGIGSTLVSLTLTSGVVVTYNMLYAGASISNSSVGLDSVIEQNIIENAGAITGITGGEAVIIGRNKIGQNARFQDITMGDYTQIDGNTLSNNVTVSNKTLATGVYFKNNTIGINMTGTETFSTSIIGKRIIPGYSDAEITVDITGLTTLAIPVNYAGIINITSTNATETISTITGFPTDFPFQLRPESGLTLTVTGTAIGSIGANQVALTTASVAINGTKKEWVELKSSGSGWTLETNRLIGIV